MAIVLDHRSTATSLTGNILSRPTIGLLFNSVLLSIGVKQLCSCKYNLYSLFTHACGTQRAVPALVSPRLMSSRHRILEPYGRWHATILMSHHLLTCVSNTFSMVIPYCSLSAALGRRQSCITCKINGNFFNGIRNIHKELIHIYGVTCNLGAKERNFRQPVTCYLHPPPKKKLNVTTWHYDHVSWQCQPLRGIGNTTWAKLSHQPSNMTINTLKSL